MSQHPIPPHPKRPAMLRKVTFLNYPSWPLVPHTILKAHIHYLLASGEVDASTIDIAKWSRVSLAVATKYRVALARLGVVSIEYADNGQRRPVYLHPNKLAKLSNSDGPKLMELAKQKASNLFSQNTQENHVYSFKKERKREKKDRVQQHQRPDGKTGRSATNLNLIL